MKVSLDEKNSPSPQTDAHAFARSPVRSTRECPGAPRQRYASPPRAAQERPASAYSPGAAPEFAMSDGEERDRKPQVNGQGADETIQIKVKMGG